MNTREALPDDPPWLVRAFAERGVKEIDPGNSARIVEYHKHTSLGATSDTTPWCSSFCCWVFENEGVTSTASAASLSWLRWGREIARPRRGCIVVMERLDKTGTAIPHRGHCGFWLGETGSWTLLLGGNQKDRVGVNRYPTSQILSYRWPSRAVNSTTNMASVGAGAGAVVAAAPTVLDVLGKLSENEKVVDTLSGRFVELVKTVAASNDALMTLGGLSVAFYAAWYIVSERLKKMKRFGI